MHCCDIRVVIGLSWGFRVVTVKSHLPWGECGHPGVEGEVYALLDQTFWGRQPGNPVLIPIHTRTYTQSYVQIQNKTFTHHPYTYKNVEDYLPLRLPHPLHILMALFLPIRTYVARIPMYCCISLYYRAGQRRI